MKLAKNKASEQLFKQKKMNKRNSTKKENLMKLFRWGGGCKELFGLNGRMFFLDRSKANEAKSNIVSL